MNLQIISLTVDEMESLDIYDAQISLLSNKINLSKAFHKGRKSLLLKC